MEILSFSLSGSEIRGFLDWAGLDSRRVRRAPARGPPAAEQAELGLDEFSDGAESVDDGLDWDGLPVYQAE